MKRVKMATRNATIENVTFVDFSKKKPLPDPVDDHPEISEIRRLSLGLAVEVERAKRLAIELAAEIRSNRQLIAQLRSKSTNGAAVPEPDQACQDQIADSVLSSPAPRTAQGTF